jgi:hypothetical protein
LFRFTESVKQIGAGAPFHPARRRAYRITASGVMSNRA